VNRGRFAGTVGTEEAVDLAGADFQIDAVDGTHSALEFADEAADLDSVRGWLCWIKTGHSYLLSSLAVAKFDRSIAR
jgi:hypothetical protein